MRLSPRATRPLSKLTAQLTALKVILGIRTESTLWCVSNHPRLRSDDSLPSGCAQSLDTHHTCPYGSMRAIALRSPLSLLLYPGGLTSGGVPGMMKTEMVQAFESREGSDWVLSLASPQEVRANR